MYSPHLSIDKVTPDPTTPASNYTPLDSRPVPPPTTRSQHPLKPQTNQTKQGSPDLACFQEHKISQGSLTVDVAVVEGYNAFFAHAKTASAYSGVVTYARSDLRVVAAAANVGCCAFPARAGVGNGNGNEDAGEGTAGSKGGGGGCPFECERFRLLWEAAVSRRQRRRRGGRGEEQGGQGQEQLGPEAEAVDDEDEEDAEEEEQDPRALLQALDAEGRAVMTDHGAFVLVNTYCPFNNPDEPSRKAIKHNWNVALRLRCEALRAGGRAVVLAGDLNAIHCKVDHPEEPSEAEMRKSRWVQWMRALLSPSPVEPPPPGPSLGPMDGEEEAQEQERQPQQQHPPLLVDTFRRLHPTRKGAFTCWCNQTGARQTNYGRCVRVHVVFL